jgi:hypothetical protein
MQRTPPARGYCPLFEWRLENRNGPGFCIGHTGAVPPGEEDPYYLGGCISWPDNPLQIQDYPRCTYKFQWRDDD